MLTTEHEKQDMPPSIEEQYTSAVHTSNLRVRTNKRDGADVVIAAGMSKSPLGMALLRLHSEWDGTAKPVKPTRALLEQVAAKMPRDAGGLVVVKEGDTTMRLTPPEAAAREAERWYEHELALLFGRLKTLPDVRRRLLQYATDEMSVLDGEHMVAKVLLWWLDHTCRTCWGVKWKVVPNTKRTSGRACETCRGSGKSQIPYGFLGAKLLGQINECTKAARSGLAGRFEHHHRPR